jgi:membrane-bound lytic murein transglycosylase B
MTGGPWKRLLPLIASLTALAVAGGTAAGAAPPRAPAPLTAAQASALPADGRTGLPLDLPPAPRTEQAQWRPSAGGAAPKAPTAPVAAYAPELAASGIPAVALAAYRKAEQRMARAVPGCHLRWYLVAAIGRVESNHGRFGGAQLRTDGTSQPKILGPVLAGGAGFALIRDTDHGRYDGDTSYDRAVGPMQFIPSTWAMYAADGDGDGRTDPFNIFDAALAAADYLCNGHDLATSDGVRAAVRNYNHSDAYVELVLAVAAAYARGVRVDTAPPAPGTGRLPAPPKGAQPPASVGPPQAGVPTTSPPPAPGPTATGSSTPPGPDPTPTPTGTGTPTPSDTPTPTPTPTCTPTDSPTPTPTPTEAAAPTDPTITPTDAATSSDTGTVTAAVATDTPTPTPTPTC